jgi:hypothetical protein
MTAGNTKPNVRQAVPFFAVASNDVSLLHEFLSRRRPPRNPFLP